MPHELSKNRSGEINPYSMFSIIKSLAPVCQRVTPVSNFQATLEHKYHSWIEKEFEGILTTVRFDSFPNKLCCT